MTNDTNDGYAKTYDNLNKQHSTLIAERDAVMKWFRQKLIDEPEAEKQLNDIKKQLKALDAQMQELIVYKARSSNIDDKVQRFIDIVTHASNRRDACVKVLDKVYCERIDRPKGRISNPDVAYKLLLL